MSSNLKEGHITHIDNTKEKNLYILKTYKTDLQGAPSYFPNIMRSLQGISIYILFIAESIQLHVK